LNLFSNSEYLLPQHLKTFYSLFTFYFTFFLFLTNFNIFINEDTFSKPYVMLVVLLAGVAAAWIFSEQVVALIWRKMLGLTRGSVERGEGESYDADEPPLARIENEIKILVQAFIER
jgi:hypothetical protein